MHLVLAARLQIDKVRPPAVDVDATWRFHLIYTTMDCHQTEADALSTFKKWISGSRPDWNADSG